MWRELVAGLSSQCGFSPPANSEQITRVEEILGVKLPAELQDLLKESNGIADEYGGRVVWSIERIIETNLLFRRYPDFTELYMPFDPLLFFADALDGDQFAYVITAGAIRSSNIFVWNHEDDSRTWLAPSLKRYLEERLKA
jgi:hypothetical protein